ncbi:MAG: TonB-dependent receptor, partial [Cyanobacteria bacterium P01_D01_bin.56]
NNNVLDGDFSGQLYYRDYKTRFFPFDARAFDSLGNVIFQSEIDTEQIGGRLQFDTPLFDPDRFMLTWGADFRREDTSQPLNIFDPAAFDASGGLVYNKIGELVWVPPFQQRTLGLFAQANWEVSDQLKVLGGVRHERVGVDAADFTTLAGNDITGGELTYDETLFNIGGVFDITDDVNVFANFAQGFSLADVGLVLRGAPAGFSVETLRPEAQKVDHYEVGVRGEWDSLQAALVGFYNYSELGTTFTGPGEIVRAPERVFGVEASVDAQVSNNWFLGGTFTWQEGETDPDLDDDFTPLDGFRIAPIKVTAYVENQTTPSWSNRLQALFSADRDRFDDADVFGQRAVDSYITLDYISSLDVGGGTLELGIQNLLDTDYFPVVSQLQTNELSNAAAQGRFITIGYSYKW